jgi:hypothetical protein
VLARLYLAFISDALRIDAIPFAVIVVNRQRRRSPLEWNVADAFPVREHVLLLASSRRLRASFLTPTMRER